MRVEVVVQSVAEADAARAAGADRVEVCVDLDVGGLTPPDRLVADVCSRSSGLGVHVLIRSRPGDYVYGDAEVDEMVGSIGRVRTAGVDGVVIGALTPERDVDVAAGRRLIDAAGDMSVTFHRAFDDTREPFTALDAIIDLGCDRVLTSGQAPMAPEGAAMLKRLVAHAAGRIVILAGGGIRAGNVAELVAASGVSEVHFSLAGARDATAVIAALRTAGVERDLRVTRR